MSQPYITINTLNGGGIEVNFNDLQTHPEVNLKDMTLKSGDKIFCIYHEMNGGLTILLNNGRQWTVCCTNQVVSGYLPIYSINGTIPNNNLELKLLIAEL